MKYDSISDIVKRDQLLKAFGLMLLEKNGLKNSQFVSQKMRELGRLVEGIMATEGNKNVELSNFFRLEKFDTMTRKPYETCTCNFIGVPNPFLFPNLGTQNATIHEVSSSNLTARKRKLLVNVGLICNNSET